MNKESKLKEDMKNLIRESLAKKLGDDFNVTINEVLKTNVKRDGLTILQNGDYITPMAGIEHDWKFEKKPDVAAGFYYTHGVWNFYVWGDKFCQKNPRLVVGIDFKLPTKL